MRNYSRHSRWVPCDKHTKAGTCVLLILVTLGETEVSKESGIAIKVDACFSKRAAYSILFLVSEVLTTRLGTAAEEMEMEVLE